MEPKKEISILQQQYLPDYRQKGRFVCQWTLAITMHTEIQGFEMFDILHFLGFVSYKI